MKLLFPDNWISRFRSLSYFSNNPNKAIALNTPFKVDSTDLSRTNAIHALSANAIHQKQTEPSVRPCLLEPTKL